jgi:hypothetical protein
LKEYLWQRSPNLFDPTIRTIVRVDASLFENLNKFLGEPPSPSPPQLSIEEKMSQQDTQQTTRRSISTRSIVLVILLVGLGAGAVGYGLNHVFAATNPTQQTTTNPQQWSGLRGAGPPGWAHEGGSSLSFRAISTVANVTATGFAITDSTHFTMTIAYHGTGTAPAITIVGLAPGLSGSTTLTSGWTSPTTVTLTLTGTGSLTTTMHAQALIVPLTS